MITIPQITTAPARRLRLLAPALVASALLLAMPGRALAVGQLSYGGCVSITDSNGLCAKTGNNALSGATAVAISPDGASLYAAAANGDGVSVFRRAPEGQLTYDSCVSDSSSGGACTDPPGGSLDSATAIAISPDGRSVYVAGSNDVAAFDRAADGRISYAGCVSNDGSNGLCTDVPGALQQNVLDLAISPDGGSLYVAASKSNAVTVFGRASDGQLTYAGCVSADGSNGLCADAPSTQLRNVRSVTTSADGRSLYASAYGNDSVVAFDRAPGGQITFAGCVSNDGSGGTCTDVPGTPLGGPTFVALSPDGTSLYIAASLSRAVSVYDRAAGGQITYAGCVSDDGSGGLCADVPGAPLVGPMSGAVSPDGKTVYVASLYTSTVTALDRAPAGQLTYAGCVSDDGSGGLCADLPGTPLKATGSIAVSPDGGSLYAPGFSVDTVTHLFRKTAPDTSIDSGPDEGSTISEARPSFTFSSNQAGAGFECSLDGAPFAACDSPAAFGPLAHGAHSLAVRAVTGGDPDPTPATRSFSIETPVDTPGPVGPVDTTGPDVAITRSPKRKVKTTKRKIMVTFAFGSPEQGVRFTCRLDRRPAGPCSSPISYRVGRGKHTFSVVAADSLDNRGAPATASVEVVKQKKKRRKGRPR